MINKSELALVIKYNTMVVFATALCICGVAFFTESLHCFWGLFLLTAVGSIKGDIDNNETT